ncbi:MAG: ArsA family ATPase, partial [Nitrospinae bacterium]|nr:ArsA family ATPase [Nitrospinota bacterium]
MTSLPAPLPFLREPHPRLLLFGGKGGVGKTSVAAATALSLAQIFPQQKVLVVSTDPAHSLADSFECPVGAAPRPLYERANLFGLEIDAKASLDAFLSKHGDVLKKIIVRGTYLTEEDLSQFLELQFPGLDEVMALLLIREFLSSGEYHTVVVDTAPTGHTLRLLELPAVMETWVKFLDTLLQKHRYLSRLYTGRYRAERTDAFIHEMLHDIQRVRRMLQDRQESLFVPVIIPEAMVLAETQALITRLSATKIPLRHLLVNRVI